MAKLQPKGIMAECQCGVIIGVMDFERTDRKVAGKILGQWIATGCTIIPQFFDSWSVTVSQCKCEDQPQ